jgi:hypothetical protein
MAVERLWARTRESPEVSRRSLTEGLQLVKTTLFESLADAKRNGDKASIVAISRELRSATDQLAKLDGLHAPQRVDVSVTHKTASEMLAEYREQLLAVIDAEVVEPPKEIER